MSQKKKESKLETKATKSPVSRENLAKELVSSKTALSKFLAANPDQLGKAITISSRLLKEIADLPTNSLQAIAPSAEAATLASIAPSAEAAMSYVNAIAEAGSPTAVASVGSHEAASVMMATEAAELNMAYIKALSQSSNQKEMFKNLASELDGRPGVVGMLLTGFDKD